MKRILLLGSGELGKEFVIACKRYGQYVVACDSYAGAPAMQVADEFRIVDMLNGSALDAVVNEVQPDLIVPEIEAIRTERLIAYEQDGYEVIPSARAANMTMNRKAIRDLAAQDLGLRTARYAYASTEEDFVQAVQEIGIPCVVKPLMSSSGKGQSIIRVAADVQPSWTYAMEGSRGDVKEVIVEEFIPFESEITLLTVTQRSGPTLFCPPIGHRQERGDYQESWLPHSMSPTLLEKAQVMADKVTSSLGGFGIWGVEFFLTEDDVYFSELSPRPHDTGMVTLAGCLNFNEFELHARAILGWPIPQIIAHTAAASAVLLATSASPDRPQFNGVEKALRENGIDIRLFGKPSTRQYRRMGVVVAVGATPDEARSRANSAAENVEIVAG